MNMIIKLLFIVSLLTWGATTWLKDQLPPPSFYAQHALPAPKQTETDESPFQLTSNRQRYLITPQYDYELTGVVVSYSNADGFTNIWHHRRWKDFINVRDLCVLWNPNIENGVYQKIHFSSDSWTCWAAWSDRETTERFQGTALANNHVLTDNDRIKELLMSAHIGDVVTLSGMLVNYENLDNGFKRGTSTTRTDRGQGACETIFVKHFRVIAQANPTLHTLNRLALWGMLLGMLAGIYLLFTAPYRTRQ